MGSRGVALESITESLVCVTDGLPEFPAEVVEHVDFLVAEAALAMANGLRRDRLVVQEAAASSPELEASAAFEHQETAEEEAASPRSVLTDGVFGGPPWAGRRPLRPRHARGRCMGLRPRRRGRGEGHPVVATAAQLPGRGRTSATAAYVDGT